MKKLKRIYTGIGSRSTPPEVLKQMYIFASILGRHGFMLRSGGAQGADSAFEDGCDHNKGMKEIFLPWKGFNNKESQFYSPALKAYDIAKQFHPAWNKCSWGAMKLHARNSHQILGPELDDPTDFIICWTKTRGGTNQAIRIAMEYGIPIWNLKVNPIEDVVRWMATMYKGKII